jgi:AcrR family transcriptional regulator
MPALKERRKELVNSLTKDAVYQAAVDVLTRDGTEALTMERVAVAVGMAKGNLYNYFTNKLSLLQFVYERAYEPIRQGLERIAESPLSAVDKLESIARLYFTYLSEHRGLFRFLLNDQAVRGLLQSERASMREQTRNDLAAIVEDGMRRGELRPLDPRLVAQILQGAVCQLAERQLAASDKGSVDDTVRGLMAVFLHGIVACRS